jgi:hypothetical protein
VAHKGEDPRSNALIEAALKATRKLMLPPVEYVKLVSNTSTKHQFNRESLLKWWSSRENKTK